MEVLLFYSMYKLIFSVILLSLLTSSQFIIAQDVCYNPNLVKDTTKKSIKSMAVAIMNGDSIRISYHSPGVRNRIIWGGLVPYNEVWVTGAHDATTIEFRSPLTINKVEIPAGKYALFTIPGKKEWTVILNKHWKQHLASEYDSKDDILRFNVKAKRASHLERLQYFIEPGKENKGIIAVQWEKTRIEFPFATR
jgi:hypothetical protein